MGSLQKSTGEGGAAVRPAGATRLAGIPLGLVAVAVLLIVSCSGTDGNNFQEPRFAGINGTIEGFVTDQAPNPTAAVVGANVYTVPVGAIGKTGAGGYYRLENVAAGSYDVHVVRESGQTNTVKVQVFAGRVSRGDVVFNAQPLNVSRELFFLTDAGAEGQIALIHAQGGYTPAEFNIITTPGIGGSFRSLKANKASSDELLVLSNFEHQANPTVFDVYILRLSGYLATVLRVTNSNAPKDSADFSADGTQVVVSQDTDLNDRFELWIMNRDGTNPRLLAGDIDPRSGQEFDHRGPSWSSDGSTVAFSSRRVDAGATFDTRDFDIFHALVSAAPVIPLSTPLVVLPRLPLVHVTRDIYDDLFANWMDRDTTIFYSKLANGNWQIYSAPGDDGGSPETQYTNSPYDNFGVVQSNDRRLLAWVSTDDWDGTNPDHSTEITVGVPVGSKFAEVRHITRTPPSPIRTYGYPVWRLR
ncbi:MAG: PD40 domain-containing protein [Candidatus Riflebacteria bacterium]|nr:PD40 domain-containing protein [Candidatus Riflebacteria bacterium]